MNMEDRLQAENVVQDETATVASEVAALLAVHHPTAKFDASGAVVSAGFLCAPGAPGSGQARVGHHALFPSSLNESSFHGNSAEEHVLVGAYADLLRGLGWTVTEQLKTQRPCLLVSRPHLAPLSSGQEDSIH